jgi:glycosyltransferase involved in cell wall biosynthesis
MAVTSDAIKFCATSEATLAPQSAAPPDRRRSTVNDLISVIIPVRNGEQFVERTVESVLRQTHNNIEVIVVDDGSTDQTLAIIKNVAARDRRVIFFSGPQAGVAAARNCAISHAQGDFIAPVDADDLWQEDKLALQLEALRRGGTQAGLAYCWSVIIDENDIVSSPTVNKFQFEGPVLNALVERNFLVNASAPLIRRACLEAVGGYDPGLHRAQAQGAEDWKIYLSLAAMCEFVVVPRCLVGYRKTSTNMSADFRVMQKSIELVRKWAQEQWPSVPGRHWKRERYFTNHYLANLALQRGSIGNAAAFHLRSIAAWPFALSFVATTKISIRLMGSLIGLNLRGLRRPSIGFEQFSDWYNDRLPIVSQ